MAFRDVQFPTDISYGSKGGPGFKTDIVVMDSGAEQRVSRWNRPRYTFNVSYGIKSFEQLAALTRFYISMRGAAFSFRYKDWADFTSAETGTAESMGGQSITALDQECQRISSTSYQLAKKYLTGTSSVTRIITKPVEGTVSVMADGVAISPTVNYATGILTFASAVGEAVVITAGFEFDVPVRFSDTADQLLSVSIDEFSSGSAPDVSLIEVLESTEITDDFFYGGSALDTLEGDITIAEVEGRVRLFLNTDATHAIILPIIDVDTMPAGGPWFYLFNSADSDEDVQVVADATVLFTMVPGSGCTVLLHLDYAAGTYQWIIL